MAENILTYFGKTVSSLELIPSGGGAFEVTVNDELVFSKHALGRFPKDQEVETAMDGLSG